MIKIKNRIVRVAALLLACFATFTGGLQAGEKARPLRVLRINPSGQDVPPGRQIVLQFDRPVVPVGRMERTAAEIPIEITPDTNCEWRWLDTSALACQLGATNALAPSTRYNVLVKPGITAEDGGGIAEPLRYTFVTQRPKVLHYWFETWKSPGTPHVRVTFDQPVIESSAESHLRFKLSSGTKVPVELSQQEGWTETTWLVTPTSELPLDEQVALVVEPGIQPVKGNEASVEGREIVVFTTFPEHRFLGVECRDNAGNQLMLKAGDLQLPDMRCDPLNYVSLVFSSPVIKEVLRDHLTFEPDLAGGREDYDPWERMPSHSRLSGTPNKHRYAYRLPEMLKAFSDYHLRADASALRDEFDRPLTKAIDFSFHTNHRRPRLHLGHTASVLERQVETHLPVVVTNLDAVNVRLRRWTGDGVAAQETRRVATPDAQDVAFRFPLPVRDWLDGRSGAVVGEASAEPSTGQHPAWFFSQVTPFQVHVKLGHYNTLVWVTDLASGKPVEGARVEVVERIYETLADVPKTAKATGNDRPDPRDPHDDDADRSSTKKNDGSPEALTDERGIAVLDGSEVLDPELQRVRDWKSRRKPHLFVRVEKDGELALIPLARDFMVRTSSFVSTRRRPRHGHLRAWGATAQGIYRAGDNVQYKIYVRNEGNETLTPAPEGSYQLRIVDPMGKTVHELGDIELNAFGAFDGEFKVPESGAVGWYRFELRASFAGKQWWQPLEVLISDFTPAPFRVTTDLNGDLFRQGERIEAASRAALHSGGPYVDAQARVTAILRPTPFRPTAPVAKGFWFSTGYAPQETLHQSEGELDGQGTLETSFDAQSEKIVYGTLTVESAVRDDRGKYVSGRATARYAGRDRFVGIRQNDWVLSAGEPAEVFALVTDELGQVASGVAVDFKVERRKTQASRVKGAGNAYLTHYVHSWEPTDECTETSGNEPVSCTFAPETAGLYRVTASIQDTRGRTLESQITRWSTGPGTVLWEQPAGHELEVLPEKETLRVGETARYLVKNPFPGARALLTVERYGVLKSWTETLDESTSIVEFPVEPDFLPGFYLSVVVMSPRVEKPLGDDHVDLGKPSFRIGYARTPVRDAHKELDVTVEPAQEEYKPRDTVSVEIRARARGDEIPEMEFAVAVLDEAVLDLLARGTELFDPYEGFYNLDSLDLLNYNLLTRLIGIQKFEKKGANPGGGGGGMDETMRSQFEFVSYWNPSVWPDADGRARIEFDLPDNLTGWRVLVMAVTPGDRMGLGQGSFRVNRPTEIRPALPNQLIEGDRFEARFTVMNRTDAVRTLGVTGMATGAVAGEPMMEKTIEAEPYKRHVFSVPVTTTAAPGEVRLEVRAGDDSDADGLILTVPVNRRQALEAAATYGTTVEDEVHESLQFPNEIRTDVGRVSVVATPTVIGGVEGAFEYLRDYPYICWEQVLTKGVMASHYRHLRPYLPAELEWPEAAMLVQSTLDRAANYQAPNGGMCYYVPRDEYVSPYLSAYTALAFQWLRNQGHAIPTGVEDRLHEYLLKLLRKDVFPTFYSKGMASSVRAVALAALSPSGKVTFDDVSRYRGHVPEMDLFGKAHYLQALNHVQGTGAIKKEVLDLILSHANESGGKIAFTELLDDGFSRMLHSELRTSCSVLSALAGQSPVLLEQSGAKHLPFKMVRSITQTRKQRNRWENTQENMFCMNALVDYRQRYEAIEPKFSVQVHLNDRLLGATRFKDFRAAAADFERPIGDGDPGQHTDVRIRRKGEGRLYYAVRLFYSPSDPKRRRINSGIEVLREYSVERDGKWIGLDDPLEVQRGELVRVDLYVTLPAPRNFVIVDDPIPGGLEPVNRDLATASTVDADKATMEMPPDAFYFQYDDWYSYAYSRWSFYHKELRNDSARFYSEYLPAGRYHLSYVAQVIAAGEFTALPVHVEEMYDPDVFGQGLPGTLLVADEESE